MYKHWLISMTNWLHQLTNGLMSLKWQSPATLTTLRQLYPLLDPPPDAQPLRMKLLMMLLNVFLKVSGVTLPATSPMLPVPLAQWKVFRHSKLAVNQLALKPLY